MAFTSNCKVSTDGRKNTDVEWLFRLSWQKPVISETTCQLFINRPSKLAASQSLLNIIHQATLAELDTVATHTNTRSLTSAHIQTNQINGYLPPHREALHTVGGLWRSPPTHRIFNCKRGQIHQLSLFIVSVVAWDPLYLHMQDSLMCTPTCVLPTQKHTQKVFSLGPKK